MTAAACLAVDAYEPLELEASAPPKPLRVLLVAKYFKLPYRVLRCAKAAGCDVFVLGGPQGAGLKTSRLCDGFFALQRDNLGQFDHSLALEINLWADRLNIDMVLAGDGPATRSLIAIRHLLETPCFPMPRLREFDLLNDKWQFTVLCEKLRIRCPDSLLAESVEQLAAALRDGKLPFPVMVKPLSQDNGAGCVVLDSACEIGKLTTINYAPILAQSYIDGEDLCASVFCADGDIKAAVMHRYARNSFSTFFRQSVMENISDICAHQNLSGVYNFDMRRDPEGDVYFLECNPRFFFSIAMGMVAGLNLLALGLPGQPPTEAQQICAPTVVQFPKAMLAALLTPWRLRAKSWDALKYVAADPAPYLREELGLEPNASAHARKFRRPGRARSRGACGPAVLADR
jgi:hypothetical protein